jgi:hypothetical protein
MPRVTKSQLFEQDIKQIPDAVLGAKLKQYISEQNVPTQKNWGWGEYTYEHKISLNRFFDLFGEYLKESGPWY